MVERAATQVSPTAIRGTLGSLNQLMICIGILVALLVNVAIPVTDWRTMFMIGAVPAVVLFGGEPHMSDCHVIIPNQAIHAAICPPSAQ